MLEQRCISHKRAVQSDANCDRLVCVGCEVSVGRLSEPSEHHPLGGRQVLELRIRACTRRRQLTSVHCATRADAADGVPTLHLDLVKQPSDGLDGGDDTKCLRNRLGVVCVRVRVGAQSPREPSRLALPPPPR
eukprot:scaffold13863_cov35-Tisochrysis_lutea.AAC.5